jgi:hypothetical protein
MKRTAWLGALALVVLGGRAIAYAMSPSPLATAFQHRAGGPALPLVAAVAFGLAVAISAAVIWLAALGVREQRALEPRRLVSEPRLRLCILVPRAVALTGASFLCFALLESYVHWRAGLGWHGLHCLVGPAHANAMPVLAALSLLVSAASVALEHVLGWMRRTLARLAARPHPAAFVPLRGHGRPLVLRPAPCGPSLARGPPLLS